MIIINTKLIFTKHDFPTPPVPKTHNLYSGIGIIGYNATYLERNIIESTKSS
jgi:hypothetical protein